MRNNGGRYTWSQPTPAERERMEEHRRQAEADRKWAEEQLRTMSYGQREALRRVLG